MTGTVDFVREQPMRHLRDAVGTLAAVLIAFAALDDITTDRTATTFAAEYVALGLCALWLLAVTIRLFRTRHHALASISALALIGAAWGIASGFTAIRSPQYIITVVSWMWFAALSLVFAWLAWRAYGRRQFA